MADERNILLCRTPGCEHERQPMETYCEHCKGIGPVCPCCLAGSGEHYQTCHVRDTDGEAWVDIGEGPWETAQGARSFAETEVGVKWQICQGVDHQWYVMAQQEE